MAPTSKRGGRLDWDRFGQGGAGYLSAAAVSYQTTRKDGSNFGNYRLSSL